METSIYLYHQSDAKSLDFSNVFGVVKSNTRWQIVSSNIVRSYIHVVVHRYKLVVLLCPKTLDMDPMWVCDFHLLIFYGFSSKLLEPQFKLDDLRNHFCNSVVMLCKNKSLQNHPKSNVKLLTPNLKVLKYCLPALSRSGAGAGEHCTW